MNRSPVLILGIGNLLLSDEGVGIHAVRALGKESLPDNVHLLDGGTGGFHLLSCFQDFPWIVFIDAALDSQTPGTVSVTKPRFAADFPRVLSAHDLGLRDLIESATLLSPLPQMHLVTVSIAAEQPMGTDLSPPVRTAVSRVVWHVRNLVLRAAH